MAIQVPTADLDLPWQAPYRGRHDSIGFAVAILTRSRAVDESAAAVQHASMSPGAHDRFNLPYPTRSPVPVPTPAQRADTSPD